MLENDVWKISVKNKAIASNHDLLWLITRSISRVGWQIHSLSTHGWFNKINVILGAYLKGVFHLIICMYQGNGCKWDCDLDLKCYCLLSNYLGSNTFYQIKIQIQVKYIFFRVSNANTPAKIWSNTNTNTAHQIQIQIQIQIHTEAETRLSPFYRWHIQNHSILTYFGYFG